MIEVIDNAVQLAVTLSCGIYAAVLSIRRKNEAWFLLTCFYAVTTLGLTYWVLFLVLRSESPTVFYVSDLCWIASVLFLILLQTALRLPGERDYRPLWVWVGPAFCAVMCLYFFRWGEYFINILWAILLGTCGYFSLRGLLFARRQTGAARVRQYFHIAVLGYILLEYSLWVSSCGWCGDTLENPYFWFDFLLTAGYSALIPALQKAVEK